MDYLFGPVPSRRLGRSLGVDLIPFKSCPYDCIYCQLGRTRDKTTERRDWVPIEEVLAELETALHLQPDYITLSGSGEPTLCAHLEQLIGGIKSMTQIPVAVLTNGALLYLPEVRRSLLQADLVAPSLDAGSAEAFQLVNRPHSDISFEKMLGGLIDFRREFSGQYWLEVLLLAGVNTDRSQIEKLAECIKRIGPDRVQVNTVTRPGAEDNARAVPQNELEKIAAQLAPNAQIIADYMPLSEHRQCRLRGAEILNLLKRRPCSIEDIAEAFALSVVEAVKQVAELIAQGQVEQQTQNDRRYYKIASGQ